MAPPQKSKFECCQKMSQSSEALKCQNCNKKYHYSCVSVNETSYKDLTDQYKSLWLCPACLRLKADNTNTPIRHTLSSKSSSYSMDDSSDVNTDKNVTIRRKDGDTKYSTLSPECLKEVRSIFREEMKLMMNTHKESIIQDINTKMSEVLTTMTEIGSAINFLEHKYEDIKKDIAHNDELTKSLVAENKLLKQDLIDIKTRLSAMEQHSRANNLEIQCIPENKSENILRTVKQIAATIQCPISDSEILSCSRIMKQNKESPRPRTVLVKFCSPRVRDNFLVSTINFNRKAATYEDKLNTSHIGMNSPKKPIYVCEHLPPSIKALHAEARAKAKLVNYRYVWVKNGRVFMRKNDRSEYNYIKNTDVLNTIK